MVYEHINRWIVVPVGLFDIVKGAFPTWLALYLGLNYNTAVLAGLSAAIGHDWPIFLGFTGGRGLSPYLGMMLIIISAAYLPGDWFCIRRFCPLGVGKHSYNPSLGCATK